MQEDSSQIIRQMVERMPQWLRTDLSAPDPMLRGRAEDALVAMIIAAIAAANTPELISPPIDGASTAPTSN